MLNYVNQFSGNRGFVFLFSGKKHRGGRGSSFVRNELSCEEVFQNKKGFSKQAHCIEKPFLDLVPKARLELARPWATTPSR